MGRGRDKVRENHNDCEILPTKCVPIHQVPPRHPASALPSHKGKGEGLCEGHQGRPLQHEQTDRPPPAQVKSEKMGQIIAKATLQACRTKSKAKIPELLEMMETDSSPKLQHQFYGYLAAFVCSIYGHRPGVLANLTIKEVLEAKRSGDPAVGFVVSVEEHKTNKDFGAAQIFFEPEEFKWMEDWLRLRDRTEPKSQLFLCTSGRGPAKSLIRYMQAAWEEMGLPGKPSFIDIRTTHSCRHMPRMSMPRTSENRWQHSCAITPKQPTGFTPCV